MTVLDRTMKLSFDTDSSRMAGWVAPTAQEQADDAIALSLVVGSIFVGNIRRDVARPDVDDHLGFAVSNPGFRVPDHGLAAFAYMCGLSDIAIVAESVAGQGLERFALPLREGADPAFAPLGSRHGIGKLVRMADIWIDGSRNLRLRFEGSPKVPKSLDAYQTGAAGQLVTVAADRSIDALTSVVDIVLINPFAPVLFVIKGEDNAIDALDFLPFPSLVRGGLHSAERMLAAHGADDLADTATVASELFTAFLRRLDDPAGGVGIVDLDPATETGLEPALNEDLLDWMSRFFGVAIRIGNAGKPTGIASEIIGRHATAKPCAGHVLELPADCIPTIASLVTILPRDAAAQRLAGGLGVLDPSRHGKVWSLWQPPFASALEGLQLTDSQRAVPVLVVEHGQRVAGAERAVALNFPLALAFRPWPSKAGVKSPLETATEIDKPLLRSGATPGRAAVSVLVLFDAANSSPLSLIQSLAEQEGVSIGQVILCRPQGVSDVQVTQALGRLFKDRHGVVSLPPTAGRLEQIATAQAQLTGETVLIADAATVLADKRCLATLEPMLAIPDVASAGCLIRAANEKMTMVGAGYSLSQVNLRSAPSIAFEMIDAAVWRGPTTYPVVANCLSATVTRTRLLRNISSHGSSALRAEVDDLLLGIQLIEAGGINVCSTLVSAFSAVRARPSQVALTSPYRISPESLTRIVQSSTLVQRIA